MENVTIKFPSVDKFEKFRSYIALDPCEINEVDFTITCAYSKEEIQIATEVFHAIIIENK